jgi:8-oxo-dGTP diphosphatase
VRVVTVVVDGANVMGSRPDGWWRDRAGAAVRLRDRLVRACASGLTVPGFAAEAPEVVLVVEGAAKAGFAASPADSAASPADSDPVRVMLARGSGDDAIVDLVRELSGPCVVVTADRELRGRCVAAGASVLGPGWLLGVLDER